MQNTIMHIVSDSLGVGNDGTGDRDALLLTAAHLRSSLSAQRLVLGRQRVDEAASVGHLAGRLDLGQRSVLLPVANVFEDRSSKEDWLLFIMYEYRIMCVSIQRHGIMSVSIP